MNDMVERVARAIEGPHDPQNIYADDPARLAELREHKWNMLSEQERGVRRLEAYAAIKEM